MNIIKTIIFWLSRIIFGVTFIFSGFVKCIDPLGTVYKIQDYIVAMGLDMFLPLAHIGAWGLFSAELLCGVLILLGIRHKEGVILGGLFMLAMTPLTLWIALENPVTDCGCFGDALVISNWATFWKNIILSAMVVYLWHSRDNYKEYLSKFPAWMSVIGIFLLPCTIAIVTMHHLPIIDFRPYNIGADIEKNMEIPADAKMDVYETIFIYEQNGVQKEFLPTDLANIDSTWTFVDQKTILIEKGYQPPIHDFAIVLLDGYDLTYEILEDSVNRTYLCAMYDLELTDIDLAEDVSRVYEMAQKEGSRFIALTASNDDLVQKYISETGASYDFAITDPIQLKTMVRANPGIVVIENGIVIDKWNVCMQKYHMKNNKLYKNYNQ